MKQKTRSVGVAMQEQSQAESGLDCLPFAYIPPQIPVDKL